MIEVSLSMTFSVSNVEDLDAQTDAVMDYLVDLEDSTLNDSSMDVTFSQSLVTISVLARKETLEDALEHGSSAIRTAIHSAGGSTPDWISPEPSLSQTSKYEVTEQRSLVMN
jgi:hypothetical protein